MPSAVDSTPDAVIRTHIRVRGEVQGVGFRPFVYRLASELELGGWVHNDAAGVAIEVQGNSTRVRELLRRLEQETPALARLDSIEVHPRSCQPNTAVFVIRASRQGQVRTSVTPDAAICPECLSELLDPQDRRYHYPFINCTHCGPRYTITSKLPYDRPNTSMAGFNLCGECRQEYEAPLDRRFHAQPNACPACGPHLAFHDAQGAGIAVADVITHALARLEAGEILAVKGLGGFHLVCDARNAATVARLRERKEREERPFALMLANTQSIHPWVHSGQEERRLLESRERPIVLMRKRDEAALPGVAPGVNRLGLMLSYTPLHYLLFHQAAGCPPGTGWLNRPQSLILIMTSANPGGEPLVIDNREALQRLSGIADGYVMHDRDIFVRCDDSVLCWNDGAPGYVRRARGYTPRPIKLPRSGPSVLACGGWYKNTICLTRDDQAFVSQHIGDLDNRSTCNSLEETVNHLMGVLEIKPQRIAHDLHPDFFSTRFALEQGLPAIGVQHHHAHIAAVAAEHRLQGPVLGLALDGVGLGADGGIWGGELLRVDGSRCRRLAHLQELALPGGDRAAREPWRMAASVLYALGRGEEISRRFRWPGAEMLERMLESEIRCPLTSSAGRLFDAVAGLLGVKDFMRFEGQAAMMLEGLAESHGPVASDDTGYLIEQDGCLNLLPLLARLADTGDAGFGAALFHATFSRALVAWVLGAATRCDLNRVVLGGGCMLNRLLCQSVHGDLEAEGLQVYEAGQLPPNDGGLSLGQAWVALCHNQE